MKHFLIEVFSSTILLQSHLSTITGL